MFQKDNEEKTKSSQSGSGTGRGEKAGSGGIRKQRPTKVSLTFGTRVGSGLGAGRAVIMREAGGLPERDRPMAQWAAVASCKRPMVPSSSQTCKPRGSDSAKSL